MPTRIAIVLALTVSLAWAQPTPAQDGSLETARVSAVDGYLEGRGPYDDAASELSVNAVLRAGDEIFTDAGTRQNCFDSGIASNRFRCGSPQ